MKLQKIITPLFLIVCMTYGSMTSFGQTSYSLVQVNAVDEFGLYVIEMDGHVLNNSISSKALTSTTNYITNNLTGSETYVWMLEKDGSSFAMKNVSLGKYLNNLSSTELSFSSTITSRWIFSFSNGLATIQTNSSGQLRSIGDVGRLDLDRIFYEYKAYTNNNLATSKHEFTIYQLVSSQSSSISSAEYATFSSEFALDFSGEEGLKVYAAEVNEAKTKVMLREVTSKRVPANTALVLHGAAGSYTGRIIADADAITGNDLQIASEAMTGNGNIYVLNRVDGVVGFYKLKTTGTLAKGKAYISLEGNIGAPMLSMSEDSEVTAIEVLPTDACQYQKGYYTLDGRLVERPMKGVYVVDGRKIVVK